MIDMRYTSAEAKEEAAEYSTPEQPEYPWGLQIRLEDEELTKLGISSLPSVGDEYRLSVVATVQNVSQTQMASGDAERCVCLQITMMSVDPGEAKKAAGPSSAPRRPPGRARMVLSGDDEGA